LSPVFDPACTREIRRIAYTESPDLHTWTQPRLIVGTDELDALYLYGMPVTRYQNMYLGLLQSLYDHADYDKIKVPKSHEVDLQLSWSPDGLHWERHPERRDGFVSLDAEREGWALDRATDFCGDAVDHVVNWEGQADLSAWTARAIRLEFRLVRASLYSFWFG